ncbi:MAG: hypothetical protein J7L94_15395 [Caldisericaceae bacterium]|nr:hypothetical protein [Caldisericaceae bacterium]
MTLTVSAPGRICLFGEHQDYLQLPVITMAIDRRISISGKPVRDKIFHIELPDISDQEIFELPAPGQEIAYIKERDYWRSVFNIVLRQGLHFTSGCHCKVHGNIPINSGTSSSSALCVAWTKFLCKISQQPIEECGDAKSIARLAHLAEVIEFGEPGGMMDHYASAVGGILFQQFENDVRLTPLKVKLGTFVLGDSQQAKDTKGILSRVKFGVLDAMQIIKQHEPQFDLATASLPLIERFKNLLTNDQFEVLQGTILNRNLTQEALKIMQAESFDEKTFAQLLNEHQQVLARLLKISTPKIDAMLSAALKAGALGGKINGSGGGGCMFVYAPTSPDKVAQAIEEVGGKAYLIQTDCGVRIESD